MSDYRRFRLLNGSAVTASIAANRTLTALSTRLQALSATAGGLAVIMPDATKMETGGPVFVIQNTGTNSILIKNSAGSTIATAPPGLNTPIYLSDNTTSAGVWHADSAAEPSLEYLSALVLNSAAVGAADYAIVGMSLTTALVHYTEAGTSFMRVLTLASGAITAGTALNMGAITGGVRPSLVRLTDTVAIIGAASGANISSRVLTISGTTVTVGAATSTGVANAESALVRLTDTTAVLMWLNATANYCCVVTQSGTTTSHGATYTVGQYYAAGVTPAITPISASKVISVSTNGAIQYGVTLTVTGTTITGSAVTVINNNSSYIGNWNGCINTNDTEIYFINNNGTVAPTGFSFATCNISGAAPRVGTFTTSIMQQSSASVTPGPFIGVRGNYIYHGATEFIFAYKVLDATLLLVAQTAIPSNAYTGQVRSCIVDNYILSVFKHTTSTFANVALTSIT